MPLWTSNMLDGTLHQSSPGWKLKKLGCKSYTELKLPTCWMQRAGQRVDDDLRMIDDSYCQPYQVFYCHCTTCRLQTGALAVLFGAFPRSSVIEISTHCSFNVFLVSFSSCFDWFLMWYTSLNNFTQVNLNTSLTRFQSSELPSYRVFCSKCGSFVAMDYGE